MASHPECRPITSTRCRVAQLIDGVHDRIARRIAADGIIHAPDIVVDCSRKPHDGHPCFTAHHRAARERAVAANDDEPLDAAFAQIFKRCFAPLGRHKRLAACRSEKRPAALDEITDAARRELLNIVVHHAAVAVVHSVDLDTLIDSSAHHSTRRRIHPRAVAA